MRNTGATMPGFSRRQVLTGSTLLAAASVMPLTVTAQTAANYSFGTATATVLSDGHMLVPLDRLAGQDGNDVALRALLAAEKIVGTQHRFAVNITLLEMNGKRILIDAGAGGTWVDTAGKLSDSLSMAGIDSQSIDHVILTHAHPDHLWGVVDDFDNSLRFPNATYSIPNAEFEFWMSPSAPEAAGAVAGITAGARRVLTLLEPKLRRVAAENEVLPGLSYVDAKGHTPGQCAVLASSGRDHVLIAADTIFHPVVSVRHPDWQPAQDMDGAAASRSRRRILDIAAARKALVVAYHITTPGVGRIARSDAGFSWTGA